MIGIVLFGVVVLLGLVRIFFDDRKHTEQMGEVIRKQNEYFSAHDPHCDCCALGPAGEPTRPVIRCAMHCAAVAGMAGDPLFGFDFEKYKEVSLDATPA